MTDSQENKFNSFEASDFFLNHETIKPIWQGDADFAALVAQLHTLVGEIHNLHALQIEDNTGVTIVKAEVRKQLIDAVLKVIYAVDAHAIFTNDPELQASVSFTMTDLFMMRDNALADTALTIYNIAWPIRVALAARRLTEAGITLVSTLREQYLGLIPERRFTVAKSKSATKDIREKLEQAGDLLTNKIDRTIMMFQAEFPDFIDQYFITREIINLGVRHGRKSASVYGTVCIAGTQIPLPSVTITQPGTDRKVITGASGKYKLRYQKPLMLTLLFHLEGYTDQTIGPFPLELGQKVQKDIYL
jgi:hypothetical protein